MLEPGDIISTSFNSKKFNGLIMEKNSYDEFTIALLEQKNNFNHLNEFKSIISTLDLDEGFFGEEYVVLIDKVMTINLENSEKIAKINNDKLSEILRIFTHYAGYSYFKSNNTTPNEYISPSGKILNEKELFNMLDASLDMWLTSGRFDEQFSEKFKNFLGVKHVLTSNSGSSANLLALSALTSHLLEDKKLNEHDEVITISTGFPTTIAPIIQNNLIPIFVDIELGTYNINVEQIEEAISERTKAIFVAHTLGNPFDIKSILKIAKKHDLWLIEDNCDALGSKYDGKYTGTFGHISTFSFYPAHHITMGEGGAIATNDDELNRIILSYRDWGRDCWCATGQDNTCGRRFEWQLGNLPYGYDHKYIYSNIGYNLKITDWQAAIGLAQLEKLPMFIKKRKINFEYLKNGLKELEDDFILPYATKKSDPSWFGFPITLNQNKDFNKIDIIRHLEKNKIGTRQLFAGNMLRQPAFVDSNVKLRIRNSKLIISKNLSKEHYSMLPNTDKVMNDTFWIGIWPGIDENKLKYMIDKIKEFVNKS